MKTIITLMLSVVSTFAYMHHHSYDIGTEIIKASYSASTDTVKWLNKVKIIDTLRRADRQLVFKKEYTRWTQYNNDSIYSQNDTSFQYSYIRNDTLIECSISEPYNEDFHPSFNSSYNIGDTLKYSVLERDLSDTTFHFYNLIQKDTAISTNAGRFLCHKYGYRYIYPSGNGGGRDTSSLSYVYFSEYAGFVKGYRENLPKARSELYYIAPQNSAIETKSENRIQNCLLTFSPSPFSSYTTIMYSGNDDAIISIYNVIGCELLKKSIKSHERLIWHGENNSSGFYLCKLTSKGKNITKRILNIK